MWKLVSLSKSLIYELFQIPSFLILEFLVTRQLTIEINSTFIIKNRPMPRMITAKAVQNHHVKSGERVVSASTTTVPPPSAHRSLQTHVSRRRQIALALLLLPCQRVSASGLESIDLPTIDQPEAYKQWRSKNQAVLDSAEDEFQNSELLKTLKARSDEKRDQRQKEMREKNCLRQAELGIGDCAGLRLIPGKTKSGVQEKPQWLKKLVGEDDS